MNWTVLGLIGFAIWMGVTNHASAAIHGADIRQQPLAQETLTDQNIKKLKSQALAGNLEAANQLGRYYLNDDMTCNSDAVARGFRRVDERGYDAAMANGEYLDDLTYACSATQAVTWLKIAVAAQNPQAMNNLGSAYDELGDETKALVWYSRAASAGQKMGQFNLGLTFLAGRGGLTINKAAALFWVRVSESEGPITNRKFYYPRLRAKMNLMDRSRAEELFQRFQKSGVIPPEALPKVEDDDSVTPWK